MTEVTKKLIENHELEDKYHAEISSLDKQLLKINNRKIILGKLVSKTVKWRNGVINRVKPEELKEYQQIYANK